MSHTDDTQPNRGRPVLKRVNTVSGMPIEPMAKDGLLWMFCGEYEGSEQKAVDAADADCGTGGDIYKVFPSGSWPGGYLRD